MLLRLHHMFATAVVLFPFILAAAAASSSLDSMPSTPHSSTLALTAPAPANISNVPDLDLVQIAYDNIPDEEKIPTRWKGKATIEVYMITNVVNNVGNVTGPSLYHTIYEALTIDCPDSIGGNNNKKCYGKWHAFSTRYRKDSGETTGMIFRCTKHISIVTCVC